MTYDSICHLRSQSANAQLDYRGACERIDTRPWELCRDIRHDPKRCGNTEENCSRRVRSRDGCCPICGEYFSVFGHSGGVVCVGEGRGGDKGSSLHRRHALVIHLGLHTPAI